VFLRRYSRDMRATLMSSMLLAQLAVPAIIAAQSRAQQLARTEVPRALGWNCQVRDVARFDLARVPDEVRQRACVA
jgi:hypothetical protein